MKEKDQPTAVYDIVIGGRQVIYVGMSSNPERRMREHRATGFFPTKARMRVYRWFDSRYEANIAEGRRQRELIPHTCKHFEVPIGSSPEQDAEIERQSRLREQREIERQEAMDEFNRTHTVEDVREILKQREEARQVYAGFEHKWKEDNQQNIGES